MRSLKEAGENGESRIAAAGPAGVEDATEAVIGSAHLEAREAPGELLVAPWGEVASTQGSFVLDEAAAELVLGAFARHGTELPIDYEHQSLGGAYASPTGQAPAPGCSRRLWALRPGEGKPAGLYAEVGWTEAGRAKVAAGEYRYLSPVVLVRKVDRRVVALHSAALTNKPAIVGLRPIAHREAAAVEQDVMVGDESAEAVPVRLREVLALGEDVAVGAVMTAAAERLAALSEELARRDARERVAAAVQAGKVAPVQRAWAEALALKDAAMFEAWAASAPRVMVLGRTEPPEDGAGAGSELVIASARREYRSRPELATLTSEEAWVGMALRERGLRK